MLFTINEDDEFLGTPSDTSNIIYQATAPVAGVTTLSLLEFPTDGQIYIFYTLLGGGTQLQQLFLSDLNDTFIVPPGADVYVFYEPPADFVGAAGNVRLQFDNALTSGIDEDVTFNVLVNGQIDDAPTGIALSSIEGSTIDGFVMDDGLFLPDGFLGGRYFNDTLVQSPDLFEKWGVILGADDLDISQGLADDLTFEVMGAAAADFEIIKLSNETSLLRMRETAIFDADVTPSIDVTIRVSDIDGRTYSETLTFQVADFDETIGEVSGLSDRYAYDTASEMDDRLVGNDEANEVYALGGDDVLYGLGGDDVLSGGDGSDIFFGGEGADIMNGGTDFDIVSYSDFASGVTASLYTGQGSGGDSFINIEGLIGSQFNDLLIGNDGSNDRLEGGAGNDALRGNGGDDAMFGGEGSDLFFSGFGADSHDGGSGMDTVTYNQANAGIIVRLDMGQGFFGQAEGDTYTAIESVVGTAFRDLLTGNAVANRLEGRAGNDDLFGLAGSDTLLGGNGNDRLDGGTGFDMLTGGLGQDVFVFASGYHGDRIEDFTDGEDALDLTAFGFSSFAHVNALASQDGADTLISFGNGDALRLVDFDLSDFDANDVII